MTQATMTLQQRMAAAAAAAKAAGQDMNEVKAGAEKVLAPKGNCRVRLVGYIEMGIHDKIYEGKVAGQKPYGRLVLELSGPNHKPQEHDGKQYPYIMRIDETIGQTAKNAWSKIFKQMAAAYPGVTQFYEMLGDAGGWRAEVLHGVGTKSKKPYATLKGPGGYVFKTPTYQDEESGETKTVVIAPALTKPHAFIWDFPSLEDWDSLYVEGKYDDGGPKNWVQEKIKHAHNWIGSPMYVMLMEAGREADTVPNPLWKEFGGAGSGSESADGEESSEGGDAKPNVEQAKKPVQVASALDSTDDPMAGIQ